MIKNIEIKNFRTFRQLKIEDFGQINVFIGKNNLGKSSLLEAIYLASDAVDEINVSSFYYILKRRGFSQRLRIVETQDLEQVLKNFQKHIFYDGKEEAEIVIGNSKDLEPRRKIRLCITSSYSPRAVKDMLANVMYELTMGSRMTVFKYLSGIEFASVLKVNRKPSVFLIKHSRGTVQLLYLAYKIRTGMIKFFLDTCYLCGGANKLNRFIKSIEGELESQTYSNLKEIISNFFDEKVKSFEPSFSDYFVRFDNRAIPFSMLGDGVRYFITHYLVLNVEKPAIVFLEEPENFMHPGLLDLLTRLIAATKHQIFIVTHSLEFLEKLLWYALEEEANLKVFGFYALKDGIPMIEAYDLKNAYNSIYKLDIDLR